MPKYRADYDVVVVGARCAGSATALLLARAGMRVLLLDRTHPARDTLSTHALMRAGVLQLDRWGVLPRIVAAGTPPITATTFHYGERAETVALATPLYAPRRPVLDTALLDAALGAGVEARFGTTVVGVERDRSGRVVGARFRMRGEHGAEEHTVSAALTVGADGLRSVVARAVAAPTTWQGRAASACLYGYWPAAAATGYDWFYRPGRAAGIIPTNDGQVCIWTALPARRFAQVRAVGLPAVFAEGLAGMRPEIDDVMAALGVGADRTGPLRGFPGEPAVLRRPHGPGWALVGDAGYFKDPLTAHGITDALRDAELLARAAVDGGPAAFAGYEDRRDTLARPLLEAAELLTSYAWDLDGVEDLLRAESAAMRAEVAVVRAFGDPLDATALRTAA
jgi:2-polyprenyl-6-methoxyphenol hydroxylase-like FAD-dependent oxidoreductase